MLNYLPLTEYSSKYKVSISTLRRRIKSEDIHFSFEDGRYLILDEPMSTPQGLHSPSLNQTSDDSLTGAPLQTLVTEAPQQASATIGGLKVSGSAPTEEPILTAANRLLTELKRAYAQILQEKEEQILHLKEEVADLKTLVRVLESDNERLKKPTYFRS